MPPRHIQYPLREAQLPKKYRAWRRALQYDGFIKTNRSAHL